MLLKLYPELAQLVKELRAQAAEIPVKRQEKLRYLATYAAQHQPANLNFICTHNSRRSHLGMIWAAVAGHLSGREDVATFSGGTEATALNHRMVEALSRAGFRVHNPGGENPRYEVRYAENAPPLICFSKRYNDPANPVADFLAVMTCDDADVNCPLIPGADFRLSLTYRDPKEADDTPGEAARYDERLRQIGRELLFALA